jgi:hypothetical protein
MILRERKYGDAAQLLREDVAVVEQEVTAQDV